MGSIKQAVILCGGLGTRLRPLTDSIPKPMAPVGEFPFLHFLLKKLIANGISDFLLLTGYRGEQIEEYFKNGQKYGVKISYSHGPVEWDTARRLIEAKDQLEDLFLLLYSDNFIEFEFSHIFEQFEQSGLPLCLTLAKKKSGNIKINQNGLVLKYDKKRSDTSLDLVEIGFMIVKRDSLSLGSTKHESFSDLLNELVQRHQVTSVIYPRKYYSISDVNRLNEVREYLSPKKIILIDRDGIINEKAPKGEYITRWSDFRFMEQNLKGLKKLSERGFDFIIISNQAGVGRGVMSSQALETINNHMMKTLHQMGVNILKVFCCEHHWEVHCNCRKPKPAMFFQASEEFLLRLNLTLYIGDDPRDCTAAYNAGCKSVYIGDSDVLTKLPASEHPIGVFPDISQGASFIETYFHERMVDA